MAEPCEPITFPRREDVDRLVDWALREDGDGRDVTADVVGAPGDVGDYALVARQGGVFAGRVVLDAFVRRFAGQRLTIRPDVVDGQVIGADQTLATVAGPRRVVLRIERPMLNFLQRLCGVATVTRRFVEAVAGTRARILDTRKTVPGWRQLDKYAVRGGGGMNHRMGLHDAVLVKDNHLAGVPIERLNRFVAELVDRAGRHEPQPAFVEIEVDSLEQLRAVLSVSGVDRVLLDNFTLDQMRQAVAMRDAAAGPTVKLEASGGVDIESVRAIAETGVDYISVGALTHSAPALDLALDATVQ